MATTTSTAIIRATTSPTVTSSCKPAVLWSGNVVFSSRLGGHQKGGVAINSNGTIERCLVGKSKPEAKGWASNAGYDFLDLGDETALSPGLVDVHAHISELGRNWEGYETATRAATAGGITTLMGMPLNSIPATTCPESVELEKEAAVKSPLMADVGLWGGVVLSNVNRQDLCALLDSGVFGLKAFLSPLPDAAGFQSVSPEQLAEAATICGERGKPILVHSELMSEEALLLQTEEAYRDTTDRSYKAHVLSRPPEWERAAIEVVANLSDRCQMHIVHLSDAGCLPIIASTKENGGALSVETCPHYLLFDSESIADGETRLKCFPPIRDHANRNDLWNKGLKTGLIDMIASDHSPCSPELRLLDSGNMKQAWGGLSGLQYQLPATYKEAVKRDCSSLCLMASWWSENPSLLIPGLAAIKGSIDEGKQADLVWWDPSYVGPPREYCKEYHRWEGSYFADMSLHGRVIGTWLRGMRVYDGEVDKHADPVGRFLLCS